MNVYSIYPDHQQGDCLHGEHDDSDIDEHHRNSIENILVFAESIQLVHRNVGGIHQFGLNRIEDEGTSAKYGRSESIDDTPLCHKMMSKVRDERSR